MPRLFPFPQSPRLQIPRQRFPGFARHGVACFSAAAVLLCLASCLILQSRHQVGLLETANKIGPSAQSLVEGRGLAICYGAGRFGQGELSCLHGQRMPVAPVTVAALYLLFGRYTLLAALIKTLIFLLPVLLAFALAWGYVFQRSVSQQSVSQRSVLQQSVFQRSISRALPIATLATFGLFFLALLLPPLLDTAVNLNFEEAYFYGWLALAIALILFRDAWQAHPHRWAVTVWLSLALVYLTKSSMLPAAAFLAIVAVTLVARAWHRPTLVAALLVACVSVPLAWGMYQYRTSGRFTVGTSLDGVNLYKGNNPGVSDLYPALRGASLDETEASLFAGNISLDSDWAENDFAMAQARSYIRSHPAETLRLDLCKATVFFLGLQRNLGEDPYPRPVELAFNLGMFLFRLMLLAALAFAIRNLFTKPDQRFPAVVFLGCVVCTAIPYIVGFALTRHSLVLILPTAAYLASLFVVSEKSDYPPRSLMA